MVYLGVMLRVTGMNSISDIRSVCVKLFDSSAQLGPAHYSLDCLVYVLYLFCVKTCSNNFSNSKCSSSIFSSNNSSCTKRLHSRPASTVSVGFPPAHHKFSSAWAVAPIPPSDAFVKRFVGIRNDETYTDCSTIWTGSSKCPIIKLSVWKLRGCRYL